MEGGLWVGLRERAVEIYIQHVKRWPFIARPEEADGDNTEDNRGVLTIFGDSIEYNAD